MPVTLMGILATLRGMPCDFIKMRFSHKHLQKNIRTLFRNGYSTKQL